MVFTITGVGTLGWALLATIQEVTGKVVAPEDPLGEELFVLSKRYHDMYWQTWHEPHPDSTETSEVAPSWDEITHLSRRKAAQALGKKIAALARSLQISAETLEAWVYDMPLLAEDDLISATQACLALFLSEPGAILDEPEVWQGANWESPTDARFKLSPSLRRVFTRLYCNEIPVSYRWEGGARPVILTVIYPGKGYTPQQLLQEFGRDFNALVRLSESPS